MAAGFVGTLAVGVVMDTNPLVRGASKARKEIASVSSTVGSLGGRLGGVGTSLLAFAGGALTAATAISKLNTAFTDIDNIAKAADRLGTTTETLVGLQRAADLSGVSNEVFVKSLDKMNKGIGEAILGTGTAKIALEDLGLSARALSELDAGEAFAQIADSIRELPTQAEKAAAATALFGRSGAALLPVFEEGGDAIRAAAREAERLGGTFSREDAAKVEGYNDAVSDLSFAFNGLFRELAIALAPALEDFVRAAIEVVVIIRGAVEWVSGLIEAWKGLGAALKFTAVAIGFAIVAVGAIIVALKVWAAAQAVVLALSGPGGWAILAAGAVIAAGAVAATAATFGGLSEQIDEARRTAGASVTDMEDMTDGLHAEALAADEAAKAHAERQKALAARGESLTQSLRTPVEMFRDEMAELNELVGAGFITWETYARGIDKAKQSLGDALEVKKKLDAPSGTPALERGTTAAFSAVQESRRALTAERREKELADRRDKLLADIAASVKKPPVKIEIIKRAI